MRLDDVGSVRMRFSVLPQLEFQRDQTVKEGEFEKQLSELEDENLETYDNMKFQMENDVQYLERKLRQLKGAQHLNQVKLDYNLEVLRQLDLENSNLRAIQKRKINKFQSSLSILKVRMADQEKKFQEERQSLELDCQRVMGQIQETRGRMRYLARCNAEKFRK
ncbi:dynein regulatory complex protein 1, partial [Malurus melanocephalus]|uniref:dynein regulatory complex protein 1 n=1 Tax=Malurus melanocephalus TaxID=175006 RepID=UPI002547CDD9